MNKTNDFKFNLPAYSDPVDIEDLNDNFRGIDDALMAGLCKKDYTGNNMGSSDPSARKYAWAPWFEIVNDNEFDVVVTDRNAPVESEEATINIAAGQTFRKYINGRYYMNFYVQGQHDVTFKWFTNAETYINESGGGGGTGTVTSVSVQGESGSHLTASGNPIETSGTITIDIDDGYSIPSDNEQTAWDGKAADLKLEINSSTFVITAQLKDSSGNLIGNERTIDLPLESVVVSGTYDDQTKKVILTLQNGSTIEFSVADLVSGLQTELSASNKLDPDYIDYDASHRAVSDTEKSTWNAKQNAISDLDTIRSGAAAGATAVQPATMTEALAAKQDSLSETQLAAVNSGITSEKVTQISTNQTNILYSLNTGVKNKLPCKISNSNQSNDTGLKCTYNEDGTYTVTGTKSTSDAYLDIENIYADKLNGDHVAYISVTGTGTCQIAAYGWNGTGYTLMLSTSSSQGFNVGNYQHVLFRIRFMDSVGTSYNATVKAMVCTMDAWNQSHDWQPPALPNYDLTYLEAEDRAALAEVVDSGAKNLIDVNNYSNLDNVTISNGVFTTQGDTLTTLRFDVYLRNGATQLLKVVSAQVISSNGVYYWEFVAPANTNNVLIGHNGGTYNGRATINLTNLVAGQRYVIQVNVTQYQNASGAFKWQDVMICTKAAFGVSSAFVPYRYDPYTTAWQNISNSTTLYARRCGRVVTVNGYMDNISFTANTAVTIGTIDSSIGIPPNQVRAVCNVGSNAYSVGKQGYVTISSTDGQIKVTSEYSGTGAVYFSLSYII